MLRRDRLSEEKSDLSQSKVSYLPRRGEDNGNAVQAFSRFWLSLKYDIPKLNIHLILNAASGKDHVDIL